MKSRVARALAATALSSVLVMAFGAPASLGDGEATPPAEPFCFVSGPFGVTGTPGNDLFEGGFLGETARAGEGADVMFGNGGDDTLCAESGNDTLRGGSGYDSLSGGSGNDELGLLSIGSLGDADGNDQMWGGDGNDRLSESVDTGPLLFQPANLRLYTDDMLAGGGGNDTLVDNNGGRDQLFGGPGDDVLREGFDLGGFDLAFTSDQQHFGGSGNDLIEDMNGGADRIMGESGNDTLRGGGGNDKIWGGEGNDTIEGDTLSFPTGNRFSPTGSDEAYGEEGDDTLLLRNDGIKDTFSCGSGVDTIEVDPKDVNNLTGTLLAGFSAGAGVPGPAPVGHRRAAQRARLPAYLGRIGSREERAPESKDVLPRHRALAVQRSPHRGGAWPSCETGEAVVQVGPG